MVTWHVLTLCALTFFCAYPKFFSALKTSDIKQKQKSSDDRTFSKYNFLIFLHSARFIKIPQLNTSILNRSVPASIDFYLVKRCFCLIICLN